MRSREDTNGFTQMFVGLWLIRGAREDGWWSRGVDIPFSKQGQGKAQLAALS